MWPATWPPAAGIFLVPGELYYQKVSKKYLWSLGHFEAAVWMVEMDVVRHGVRDAWRVLFLLVISFHLSFDL